MLPKRVMRAAERFRAKYDLPAPSVKEYADYINYHDAIHQFAGAPPNDAGERVAIEVEYAICGKQHNYPVWSWFQRRYGHLFEGMKVVA